MATIAKLAVLLDLDDNTFTQGLENSRNRLNSWGDSLRSVGTRLTAGVTAPLLAAGIGLVKWGSDLENTMATTEKIFGDASREVIAFSDTSARSLGIAKTDALDYSIYFAGMLDTVAEGPGQLADMSTAMVGLTADFGAFFNLNPEESFTVIQSAMAGETEAIRRYGVDVSAAAVETKALELGLAATSSELTEQDKILARYHLIMEQTAHMQGQFADESDGVAGKLKILQARFKDLGTNISRHLLPFASTLLGWVERAMGWLESLSPATQKWALAIAAAAAALGPLLIALGFLLPALGTGIGLFAAMVSPIGLLVVAIGAVGVAIFSVVREFLPFGRALQAVGRTIGTAIDRFREMWNSFGEGEWVLQKVETAFGAYERAVWVAGNATNVVSRFLYSLSAALASIGGENTPAFIAALSRALIDLAGVVENVIGFFADLVFYFQRVWETRNTLNAALESIPEPFRGIAQAIGIVIDTIRDFVASFNQGGWAAVMARIPAEIEDLTTAFQNLGAGILSAIGSINWDGVISQIRTWADELDRIPGIGWLLAGALDGVAIALTVLQTIISIGQWAWEGLVALMEDLGLKSDDTEDAVQDVIDVINELNGTTTTAEENLTGLNSVMAGIPDIAYDIGRAFVAAWTAAALLTLALKALIAPFTGLWNVLVRIARPLATVLSFVARLHPAMLILTAGIFAGVLVYEALENNWLGLYNASLLLWWGLNLLAGAIEKVIGQAITLAEFAWAVMADDITKLSVAVVTLGISIGVLAVAAWDATINGLQGIHDIAVITVDVVGDVSASLIVLGIVVGGLAGAAWTSITNGLQAIHDVAVITVAIVNDLTTTLTTLGLVVGILAVAAWDKITSAIDSIKGAAEKAYEPVQNLIDVFQSLYDIVTSLGGVGLPDWLGGSGSDVGAEGNASQDQGSPPGGENPLSVSLSGLRTASGLNNIILAFPALLDGLKNVQAEADATGVSMETMAGNIETVGLKVRTISHVLSDNDPFEGMAFTAQNAANVFSVAGTTIGAHLSNITTSLQTKGAEWGATLQAGLAPLGGIAATAFTAVSTSANTNMSSTSTAVGLHAGLMNLSMATNLGAMLGSAVTNFASIRSTGVSETSSMQASVNQNIDTMQSSSAIKIAGMKTGMALNFLAMRSNATTEASTTNTNVNSQFASMVVRIGQQMALSVSVVRAYAAQWPGAFSGVRGSMYSAGADAIQGLIDGARSRLGGLMRVVQDAIAIFNAIPSLGNSPWPMMIGAGHDAMDGLRIGVEDRLTPLGRAIDGVTGMFSEASPRFAGVDMSGIGSSTRSGESHYHEHVTVITLEPEKWREVVENAKAGGTFARQFGGELAMFEGEG